MRIPRHARDDRSTQNFGGGDPVTSSPLSPLDLHHPSSIHPSSFTLPQTHPLCAILTTRRSVLATDSDTNHQPASPAKSQKAPPFWDLCLAWSTPSPTSIPAYPVWTVEAREQLRVSTPKFWTIGKPTAPSPSPRGNISDTNNRPSGTPARIQASVPMLRTWVPFMIR